MYRIFPIAVFLLVAQALPAQTGDINFLTDRLSPFPPGCIAFDLPVEPASADNTLIDEVINVPSINSNTLDEQIQVTVWRVGCADEGFSVVMVNLRHLLNGRDPNNVPPVVIPQAFAEAGDVVLPFHEAQLIRRPAVGNAGAAGGIITFAGDTFMLGVDPLAVDGATEFFPEDYNDGFSMELFWGAFSAAEDGEFGEVFFVDPFSPDLDPPQFDEPVLHGRFSGQWVAEGVERTGLLLQVAEQFDDTNFIFAIFFTYLDGQPTWVFGNTGGEPAEPGTVELEMFFIEGGEFFTLPNQPAEDAFEQDMIGTMVIEPLDCNRLRVSFDFEQGGLGSGQIDFDRFIRIAGHDCNPWVPLVTGG